MSQDRLSGPGQLLQVALSNASHRIIPQLSRYAIGDDGSVWSKRSGRWIQLNPTPTTTAGGNLPYLRIQLVMDSGAVITFYVHRLVLTAFHDPPNGRITRHLNGRCQDNRLENLTWGTLKENCKDKLMHGKSPRGNGTGRAILSEQIIRDIRKCLDAGETALAVSQKFGIARCTVYGIKHRRRWWYVV